MNPSFHRRGLIIGILSLLAPVALFAQQERILDFASEIEVHEDSTLTVTERITVYAGGAQIKRGIFRDFPQLYRGKFGLRKKTGFEVQAVLKNGQPEPYELEELDSGTRVRIGQAEVFLQSGEYTYEIRYRTDSQLGFFDDFDELYWNVTGNYWDFPIDKASATVRLPRGAAVLKHEAYTGPKGAQGRDYRSWTDGEREARFETTAPLMSGHGLTVVVSWPTGVVLPPSRESEWARLMKDNRGFSMALYGIGLVLIYYFIAWFQVGKDPAKGVIFPIYEPPAGFSPAAVRYLYRMGFDNDAFSAAVIGLAVKGAITIEEREKKVFELKKTGANPSEPLTPDERKLFDKLLGSRQSLLLKQSHHAIIGKAKEELKKALAAKLEKTHFVRNLKYWVIGLLFTIAPLAVSLLDATSGPGALFMLVWLTGWTVGTTFLLSNVVSLWRSGNYLAAVPVSLFATPFLIGEIVGIGMLCAMASIPVALLFAAGATMNGVFYHLLKAPTHHGRKVLDEIEGFKEYLGVAEEERLNLMNPPEKTPELFERFLPYALALDVDQQWSEKFARVLAAAAAAPAQGGSGYRPAWYSGTSSVNDFNGAKFASALGSGMSGALASSSTAPGSSSGGGGGGSSGGGGGGGGGGGW